MRFDEHFLRGALSEVSLISARFPEEASFSIDTRTLKKDDIFFALPGIKSDGHGFLADALAKGAAGIFIAESKRSVLETLDKARLKEMLVVAVPDVEYALVRLAMVWRSQFKIPVVGITGSVGKTSTKELLANIMRAWGKNYLISQGNQNTKIGIALNMLRLRQSHEGAIFEVGINKRNEMAQLSRILQPTTAVITNVGHCHMEGLGSVADIALEKRDIFKHFTPESIGVINGDQALLSQVGYVHPMLKFGSKTTNQIQARKIHVSSTQTTFVLKMYKQKHSVAINNVHEGVVFNALAASSVAHLLEVPHDVIIKGITEPLVVPGRFERKELKNNKGILISDCYNANPESMKAALLAFQKIETNVDKIAVLGDMLELGLNSPFWHRQLGRFLRKVPSLKQVILVGDLVQWTKKTVPVGVQVLHVATWKEAVEKLNERINNQALVLVKGSNGIGLTNLVDAVTNK